MINLSRLITTFSILNSARIFREIPTRHYGTKIRSAINALNANGILSTKAKMMDRTFSKIESRKRIYTNRNCLSNTNDLDETNSGNFLRPKLKPYKKLCIPFVIEK